MGKSIPAWLGRRCQKFASEQVPLPAPPPVPHAVSQAAAQTQGRLTIAPGVTLIPELIQRVSDPRLSFRHEGERNLAYFGGLAACRGEGAALAAMRKGGWTAPTYPAGECLRMARAAWAKVLACEKALENGKACQVLRTSTWHGK